MKKIDYERLITVLEAEGYDVHMIGQDRYFIDRNDRLGITITASRPASKSEMQQVCDFCAKNNGDIAATRADC